MTKTLARDTAKDVLAIIPLVMRTVAAELRASGELPMPAHFALLTMLAQQPRSVSELAALRGVSLPTMSNSVSALLERGWVRRTLSPEDRRVFIVEVTAAGRSAVERVSRAAEARLADLLTPLDRASARRLRAGLDVLRTVFAAAPACATKRPIRRRPRRERH
jgi:DNA-binding MarR family transcriptional regulator